METRLFWIGVAFGLYRFGCWRFEKTNALNTRLKSALWHGLFLALAGFSVTLIAVLSIESRVRLAGPGLGGLREAYPALVGALILGGFGFWRAWAVGTKTEKRRYFFGEDSEWSETVFSAILLAAVLMYFVVQAFKIPSGSMEKTLLIGDHLFVNKFIYGIRIPLTGKRILRLRKVQRGDIIVFRFPTDDPEETHCGTPQYGKDFIKRVIGLPGEEIEIKNAVVFVDGKPLESEPYVFLKDGDMRVPRPDVPLSQEDYRKAWVNRELERVLGDT